MNYLAVRTGPRVPIESIVDKLGVRDAIPAELASLAVRWNLPRGGVDSIRVRFSERPGGWVFDVGSADGSVIGLQLLVPGFRPALPKSLAGRIDQADTTLTYGKGNGLILARTPARRERVETTRSAVLSPIGA